MLFQIHSSNTPVKYLQAHNPAKQSWEISVESFLWGFFMCTFHFKHLPEQRVLHRKGRRRQPERSSRCAHRSGAEQTRAPATVLALFFQTNAAHPHLHKHGEHTGSGSFAFFTEAWLEVQAAQVTAWSLSILHAYPVIPSFKLPCPACSALTPCAQAIASCTSSGPGF